MGNRAVITDKKKEIGIYVHWNGGRDSIEAFLTYCKIKEYRNPNEDCYGWARLCQVIGNYFGGKCSVGIDKFEYLDTDNGDNGTYVIDEKWNICERLFFDGREQNEYSLLEFIYEINACMPAKEQVQEEILKIEVDKILKEKEAEKLRKN